MARRPPLSAEGAAHALGTPRLAAAVRERGATPEVVRELVRRRPADLRETLEGVVADTRRAGNVRTIATVGLGELLDSRSEPVLLRAAASADGALARRAVEALGRLGTAKTLARLAALQRVPEAAARSLAFARSLIAYRHGIEGHRLALPRDARVTPVEPRRANRLPVQRLDSRAWTALKPQLGAAAAIVGAVSQPPIELLCGPDRFLLFVHPAIDGGRAAEALAAPRIGGVLLKWSRTMGGWFVSEYLFVHPVRGGTELIGTRPSGEPVHRGRVEHGARGLVLEMAALDTPFAAPTRIDASLAAGDAAALRLEVRVEPDRSRQRRRPKLPRPAGD